MNVITIAGTVGKDAEMKYLQDSTAIAAFSVADSQGKDKTVWWNCSLFGKRAESLGQYILKGTKVTISGQVNENVWTDKNGQERKSLNIRVNDIALQSKAEQREAPRQQREEAPAVQDDDIPFADPFRSRAYSLMV